MVNQKCKKGFTELKGKCVKTSCKNDGKDFCRQNDKPLKPMISRPGGKSQLADKIIKKAPPHKTYVEPFVGGGAVFLKKPLAEKNVINDKDKEVVTVFKSFKKGNGFNKCNNTPSKNKFERLKNKKAKSACDVAFINKLSFGGKNMNYAVSKAGGKRSTFKKRFPKRKDLGIKYQKEHLDDYKEKLKNTAVLNQDFEKVMVNYDSKETFHYLDPPYLGTEKVYKENKDVSPEKVCGVAKKMRGKVMISYNDHKGVRKACKGLKIKKVQTFYSMNSLSDNRVGNKELIITNY